MVETCSGNLAAEEVAICSGRLELEETRSNILE